ncbi:MAG: hypothetical protein SGPRY_010559 [Prymnesium sp.]
MSEGERRPARAAALAASEAWRSEDAGDLFFPAASPLATAIIWCHGLEDSPDASARALEGARRRHPHWAWMIPRAPERRITAFDGKLHAAWGDFKDAGIVHVGSVDCESKDGRGWYAASVAHVHRTVEKLVTHGIPPEKIAIVGTSQGACRLADPLSSVCSYLAVLTRSSLCPSALSRLNRSSSLPREHHACRGRPRCTGRADARVTAGRMGQ